MQLEDLIKKMFEMKASDLHLRANSPPVYRIDGALQTQGSEKINPEELETAAHSLVGDAVWERFLATNETDISYSLPGLGRVRGNLFRQRGTIGVVFRMIPVKIPDFDELKLPPIVKRISAETHRGLVLVTGTTGSGKSTTLAAMIDYINNNRHAHIVTIEDPIEFIHNDGQSLVTQRELGSDTNSFALALKHVLRQDPDVILVGEMRDQETIATALIAAETGHLVLSTLHTTNAVQTINRIVDVFPNHQQNQIRLQLAAALKSVISQRLLPMGSGTGRVVAVEVLMVTPLVRKQIEENKIFEIDNAMRQGSFYGMQTFNLGLLNLYKAGLIRLDDAIEAASNPEELMMTIRGVEAGDTGLIER